VSQQLVCDNCDVAIDQTKPFYQLSGSKVQMTQVEGTPPGIGGGTLQQIGAFVTLHYHEEHLPEGMSAELFESPAPAQQPAALSADAEPAPVMAE
jgi:hypothetical protein